MRIDYSVGWAPGRAREPCRGERRDTRGCCRVQHLDRHAVLALQVYGGQLRLPGRVRHEQQVSARPVPDVDAMIGDEGPELADAAPRQLDVQRVGPLGADRGEGPAGAPLGGPVEVLHDCYLQPGTGEVVGAAGADHAGADDDDVRTDVAAHAGLRSCLRRCHDTTVGPLDPARLRRPRGRTSTSCQCGHSYREWPAYGDSTHVEPLNCTRAAPSWVCWRPPEKDRSGL